MMNSMKRPHPPDFMPDIMVKPSDKISDQNSNGQTHPKRELFNGMDGKKTEEILVDKGRVVGNGRDHGGLGEDIQEEPKHIVSKTDAQDLLLALGRHQTLDHQDDNDKNIGE